MSTTSVANPSATRPPRDPRGRSAVTNGARLHVVRPGDTKWARRFRDVYAAILSEVTVANGGVEPPEWKKQLARRCTTIIVNCERREVETAAGANIDLEVYGKDTDRLGRAFDRLGLKQPRADAAPGPLGQILSNGLSK
jgi:hypothetical protein